MAGAGKMQNDAYLTSCRAATQSCAPCRLYLLPGAAQIFLILGTLEQEQGNSQGPSLLPIFKSRPELGCWAPLLVGSP